MGFDAKRIEICGGIASGKTTLAIALEKGGMAIVLETFEQNPFWSAFYRDLKGNAFEAEISFLLQHYHGIKMAGLDSPEVLVCDHALTLDRAYAFTTLVADELRAFLSVFDVVKARLPLPALIVNLRCSPAEELRRLVQRGRNAEQTATLEFLLRLNAAIEQQLGDPAVEVPIFPIDSDRLNFTETGADRPIVVEKVRAVISELAR